MDCWILLFLPEDSVLNWRFTKGLHEVANGAYAYLQPDGSWGWSNAGLIVDENESLLVDTLTDIPLTREMLNRIEDATGKAAGDINTLVNTHAHGDHTWGNSLVSNAEIISSKSSSEEFSQIDPEAYVELLESAKGMEPLCGFMERIGGAFDHSGITLAPPTRTFSDELDLKVGDKKVRLIEVGPAHTKGDTLIYVPSDRVIFTGDILFIETTPIVWSGPVSNWVDACNFIMGLDVDVIVPGHGPITDKRGVEKVRDYLTFIDTEARARFRAGMSFEDAAADISLGEYRKWLDPERIVVNVLTLYREYSLQEAQTEELEPPSIIDLFRLMAEYDAKLSLARKSNGDGLL